MKEDEIDVKIQEALARDSANIDLYDHQLSLFQQTMQIFKGRNGWINSIMVIVSLVVLSFAIYSAVQFYYATEVKELIGWSLAVVVGFLLLSMMKIWAWLEMEKYSMIREIKRVELQVVTLAERIKQGS